MLLSAIAFIFVFGLVVLVHEWGHFVLARRAGIVVQEFGFGYPPRLKTLAVRDGVKYTLNAIPLGGFVRMLGEDNPSEPGSFASKSAWERIRTVLAGPAMNLVLAALLFSCTFMFFLLGCWLLIRRDTMCSHHAEWFARSFKADENIGVGFPKCFGVQ